MKKKGFKCLEGFEALVRLGVECLELKLNSYSVCGFLGKEMCLDDE
jgi:hypothetical protein